GAVQGRQPAAGLVVRGPACRRTKVNLTVKLNGRAGDTLEGLKQMQAGQNGLVLTLNDHCQECEFRTCCHAEATAKDDRSPLRALSEAELRAHRSKGIFTVTQLSYTFRPRRKGKRARGEGHPTRPPSKPWPSATARPMCWASRRCPTAPDACISTWKATLTGAAWTWPVPSWSRAAWGRCPPSGWTKPQTRSGSSAGCWSWWRARTSPSSTSAATRGGS